MRRYSFFVGALSAVVTFVALSAFTGRRPWSREARWPYGWHRHQCDREGRNNEDRDGDSSLRHRDHRAAPTSIDSSTREFNSTPDSTLNR